MHEIEQRLDDWKNNLCQKVEVAALLSRNAIAHKWKAPFSLIIREACFWRIHDLLSQSYSLHNYHQTLGSRILLRSVLETLSTLIYLNHLTKNVLAGVEDFHSFSEKTSRLLLGSKDKSTKHEAININTVLDKCDDRYPGISKLYASLSESAHPNFESTCFGYARSDQENHITVFSNNLREMYEDQQLSSIKFCMMIFEEEYNKEWETQFERLESWLVINDSELESSKPNWP